MNLPGPRVRLRQWMDTDVEPFAAMNADAEVMEFFPQPLTVEQSLALLEKLKRSIAARGWGLWAVEVDGDLAGFTGLAEPSFEAHFTPCVEMGWRFRRKFWGHGFALEAAQVALRFAFASLRLREVVSFTARLNQRSQRLMQRLGMTCSPLDDFGHPMLPDGHTLRCHVLYRIQNTPALLDRLNQELAMQKKRVQ
ncbi:MAG: GNAT family N-acetyltransferase [Chloroflexi bacterium]|nr:GNAT family N-acetyltransferase [Chloroflexota bacterium]